MAVGYTREDGRIRLRDYFDRSLEIGAGGIYTTVDDLAIWNHALDKPGFLTQRSLGQMFSIHPLGIMAMAGSSMSNQCAGFISSSKHCSNSMSAF
jgi:hypothetical protein